jgi:glycolate oxidase
VQEYLPDAILFPQTAQEVSQIMKVASAHNIFITPRGSGSGLGSGSLAKQGGIVLCFTMMNRILEINTSNRYAVVEPGVVISEFQKAVEKWNLFYPPDPGSATVATMGGSVVMNAGGMRGVKYGVTRDYLMGLEVVLPSGEVMKTGAATAKDVTGYDLTRLICGSEGTLALVTKIIVRLLPKPKTKRTLQAIYNRIDDAGNTVAKIIEAGLIPATLELMDKTIIKALEDFAHLGLPLDAEAILLMDVDGDPEVVEKQAALVAEFCKNQGARDIRVSQSEKENEQLWVARRSAFGAVARMRPTCVVEDATVPVSYLTSAVKRIMEIADRNRVQIAVLAHAGDGNLHPLVLCDKRDKDEMARVDKAMDEIVDYAMSVGGTLSGEHGIGVTKAKYLRRQLSETSLKMMQAIKKTFDPQGILNPGSFLEHAA